MTPFRQPIREGQRGRDVHAVKDALQTMHVGGSGSMIVHGRQAGYAGESFVQCIKRVQRNNRLHQDGVYGRKTHEIIAPHFTAYDRWLYRTAKIRKPAAPKTPTTAVAAAQRLLELHAKGQYRDDRGTELAQIRATAAGKAVWSPAGQYVHLDAHMLEALVYLIDTKHFKIGTFAMCSDHPYDAPRGHAGGHAVDISSINSTSVTAPTAKHLVLEVLTALHEAYRPWQLISGGYANHRDAECSALSLPGADSYYGPVTMQQHCNHIHAGF